MGRDDFTKKTIDTLAERVGYRCSNPNCRKPAAGPRSDTTKAVNIGVAAHMAPPARFAQADSPLLCY